MGMGMGMVRGKGIGYGNGNRNGTGNGTGIGACCLLFNYVCHGCYENDLQCLHSPAASLRYPLSAIRNPPTSEVGVSMPGSVVNSNSTWVGKPSMTLSLPRLAQLLGSFMCFVFAVACRINGIIYNLFLPELQVLKR